MKQVNFTLGSDPELFLRDAKTKALRSAVPIIPEGKGDGRKLDSTGQNCVIHDNVLIEFNTLPATDSAAFVSTIHGVLGSIQKIVKKSGLELHLQASVDFPESEICAEARIFGCDPDYTVYPEPDINDIDADAAKLPFRSAGGHLHIGKHKNNKELTELLDREDGSGKVRVVKALDIFVGIISVFLEKDPTAAARRDLYGKAGAHRPKEYGVEYRACSPWWLATPSHTELVYQLTNAALAVCLDEEDLEDLSDDIGGEDEVVSIINESKEDVAFAVFERNIAPLLDKKTVDLIMNLHNRDEEDFLSSWKL